MTTNPLCASWTWLAEVPYRDAWRAQRRLWRRVLEGREGAGTVLFLSHPPTFTTGKRDSAEFILYGDEELQRRGFEKVATDRGGLVTYHGPGQLVGYPILNLEALGLDVAPFVRGLEDVMIRLCADFGQNAARDAAHPGVWVGRDKIGAVGLRVARKVSMHGFAFNVAPNMDHYSLITACGISGRGVTSLQKLGVPATVEQCAIGAARHMQEVFGVSLARRDAAEIMPLMDLSGPVPDPDALPEAQHGKENP